MQKMDVDGFSYEVLNRIYKNGRNSLEVFWATCENLSSKEVANGIYNELEASSYTPGQLDGGTAPLFYDFRMVKKNQKFFENDFKIVNLLNLDGEIIITELESSPSAFLNNLKTFIKEVQTIASNTLANFDNIVFVSKESLPG